MTTNFLIQRLISVLMSSLALLFSALLDHPLLLSGICFLYPPPLSDSAVLSHPSSLTHFFSYFSTFLTLCVCVFVNLDRYTCIYVLNSGVYANVHIIFVCVHLHTTYLLSEFHFGCGWR